MAGINIDDLRAVLGEMVNNMNSASDAARLLAETEKAAADAEADRLAKEKAMWDSTKKGFTDLHSSLSSTSGGMTKYSSVVSNFGGAIAGAAKEFGPLGKAIGYTVDGLVKLTDMVLKQNDAILGSFKGMKDFGVTMALSTDKVLELGKQANYTSHNLEAFYKNTKSVGQGLNTLGMTTSEGIKNFSELASTTREQRNVFRSLGYSQEEFTEAQATYVRQLALTGGTLAKTPKQLGEESRKYVEQLTLLAELTGVSVKEQQKALDTAMANENFNAYMFSLEQDRLKAIKEGNKEEENRLDVLLKSNRSYAAFVTATYDAADAAARLETISNKQGVIYTETNAKLLLNGQNAQELIEMFKKGASAEEIILKEMQMSAAAVKDFTNKFGENAFSMSKASRELQETFGITNKVRALAIRAAQFENMNAEERKKFLEDQVKQLEKAKKGGDERLELDKARQASEEEYRKALDQLTNLVSGPVNSTLTVMVKLLINVIEFFQKLIDVVGDITSGTFKGIGKAGSTVAGWLGFGGGSAPAAGAPTGVSAAPPAKSMAPPAGASAGTPGNATRENPIAEVISVGSGFNIVQRPDGKKEKLEGPRNWRNNNPGNIEFGGFAQKYGAIGSDGRFAIFPSYEAGRAAKAALIFEGRNYSGLDLQSAIYRYAPPGENNSEQYFKSVLSAVGGKNKKMAEYTNSERESILSAMERMEGFKVGKVTNVSARSGGLASGPSSGYPATLHGNEAIIPLDPSSLITKLMKTPESELMKEIGSSVMNNTTNESTPMGELIAVMSEKLDNVIYALNASNNTQEEILRYSKA